MRSIRGQETRVAVVGGAGFLGSHLTDYLISNRDCKVVVMDNLSSGRRGFVHPQASFEYADITGSEDYLRKIFLKYAIDYVFNYAACPYVPTSYARPLYTFDVNAMGAMKVINAAQDAGCNGILQVSSAEVYGNQQGKINEAAVVSPRSSYGASKAAIDSLVQVRWKEAKTPCIALRQFNCLGERETHPYVVPEIISQLSSKGGELSLGNNTERDFLYAGDAVSMAVSLLEQGEFGEVYNLGSEYCTSIFKLAQTISNIMNCGTVTIKEDPMRVRPWDIWHLQSDNTKIFDVIGRNPTITLHQSLVKTVQYFEDNGRKWCWE